MGVCFSETMYKSTSKDGFFLPLPEYAQVSSMFWLFHFFYFIYLRYEMSWISESFKPEVAHIKLNQSARGKSFHSDRCHISWFSQLIIDLPPFTLDSWWEVVVRQNQLLWMSWSHTTRQFCFAWRWNSDLAQRTDSWNKRKVFHTMVKVP